MDASVPVDSRVFIAKCALRKYLVDSGPTEVVKPDGRQYTLKHGKELVEAIAAGIEPLEFSRKVEKKTRFDLVTHDPDAMFNIIAKQQRDKAVAETKDAERRQTAKRRDPRSVAAAGPIRRELVPTGTTHARVPRLLVKKQSGIVGTTNNECFVCGKQGHKQRDCPRSQQGTGGKGVHAQSKGQIPIQQQQSTNGPAQHTRSKKTGMAPAPATLRASGYKTASKAVITEAEPAAPEASTQDDAGNVFIRVPREKMVPVDNGPTETV